MKQLLISSRQKSTLQGPSTITIFSSHILPNLSLPATSMAGAGTVTGSGGAWVRSRTRVALAMGQKQTSFPSSSRASSSRCLQLLRQLRLSTSLPSPLMWLSMCSHGLRKALCFLRYFLRCSCIFLYVQVPLSKKTKGQYWAKRVSRICLKVAFFLRRQTWRGTSKVNLLVRAQTSLLTEDSSTCSTSPFSPCPQDVYYFRISPILASNRASISCQGGTLTMYWCFSPSIVVSSSWQPRSHSTPISCPNLFSSVWLKPQRVQHCLTTRTGSTRSAPSHSCSRPRNCPYISRCMSLRRASFSSNFMFRSSSDTSGWSQDLVRAQQWCRDTQLSLSSLLLGGCRCCFSKSTPLSQRRSAMQCTQGHSSRDCSQLPAMQKRHTNRLCRSSGSFLVRSSFLALSSFRQTSWSALTSSMLAWRQVSAPWRQQTLRVRRGGTTRLASQQPRTLLRYRMKSPNLHLVWAFSKPSLANQLLSMLMVQSTPGKVRSMKSTNLSHCSRCMTSRMRRRTSLLPRISFRPRGGMPACWQRGVNWKWQSQQKSRFLMRKRGRWLKSVLRMNSFFRSDFSLTLQSMMASRLQESSCRSSSSKSWANLQCSDRMMHSPRSQKRQQEVLLALGCSFMQLASFSLCSGFSRGITVQSKASSFIIKEIGRLGHIQSQYHVAAHVAGRQSAQGDRQGQVLLLLQQVLDRGQAGLRG